MCSLKAKFLTRLSHLVSDDTPAAAGDLAGATSAVVAPAAADSDVASLADDLARVRMEDRGEKEKPKARGQIKSDVRLTIWRNISRKRLDEM
jgi:hypothetical protein